MKIYLTGFPGSGKSTYGQALAKELGFEFADLDEIIKERSGKTIGQIFEERGETGFRKLETEALRETEKLQNTVIATGGGAPCHSDNMQWMNTQGTTIYLKMFENQLHERLQEDDLSQRPLLANIEESELYNWIYNKLRERAPYYVQSQITIKPEQVDAKELSQKLQQNSKPA